MKINLIGNSFEKDSGQGVTRYSYEILNGLQKRKYTVTINDNADINHLQKPELIWKALFKRNAVTTFHDVMPIFNNERRFLFRVFFYFSSLLASIKSRKIIAVSNSTKKDLIKYFPYTKNKTYVVYEAVDKENFYPLKNKKENKVFTLGYIGGLGKRKNVEFILKLAKELENNKIIFKIAGKGPDKERLLRLYKKLDLKNIEFVGFIADDKINEFYNSLDLFIFPSLYEGFGFPPLESLACGTPVLVSDKGSLPEVVPNNEFIIDIESIEIVKKRINHLIKNKEELNKMKKQALEFVKKFSWNKTIDETIKVYKLLNINK